MQRRVLVADDDGLVRKLLSNLFKDEAGYELCAAAKNGEEAITLAKLHQPDLIILDFSMPVMNGVEAARELKKIMPNVPIILFTLHADAIMYSLGNNSPFDLIVAKSDALHIVDHIRSLIPV